MHDFVVVDELEVIESSCRQFVVEFFHSVPWTVTHTNHDDGQRVAGGLYDSICCLFDIVDLTVSDNNQDMIASRNFDDIDGLCAST